MSEEPILTENQNIEVDNNVTESSPVEEEATLESEDSQSPEVNQPEEEEVESEEGEKRGTGASKRIQGLVKEKKELQQQVETLTSKVSEFTSGLQNNFSPTTPSYGGEKELTLDDLRALTQMEIAKDRAIARINSEAKEAVSKYSQLNPNSDSFDPDLNESITTAVFNTVKVDPNASVTSLVDKLMKPFTRSVEKAVATEKKELAKQVADTALRPTAHVDKTEKSVEDMSIEEIKEKYGVVY